MCFQEYYYLHRMAKVMFSSLFWCLFPEFRSNKGIFTLKCLFSTKTVCDDSTYIILFLTKYHEPPIGDDINDDIHRVTVLHSLWLCSQSNKQSIMRFDNSEMGTWKVISYSSDIDFILCDIHGLSCMKFWLWFHCCTKCISSGQDVCANMNNNMLTIFLIKSISIQCQGLDFNTSLRKNFCNIQVKSQKFSFANAIYKIAILLKLIY